MTCSEHDLAAGKLQLSKCDIHKVLANGATLFGSQGAEYDIHNTDGIENTSLLVVCAYFIIFKYTLSSNKKQVTKLTVVTSSNLNRLSKFFHHFKEN